MLTFLTVEYLVAYVRNLEVALGMSSIKFLLTTYVYFIMVLHFHSLVKNN